MSERLGEELILAGYRKYERKKRIEELEAENERLKAENKHLTGLIEDSLKADEEEDDG